MEFISCFLSIFRRRRRQRSRGGGEMVLQRGAVGGIEARLG